MNPSADNIKNIFKDAKIATQGELEKWSEKNKSRLQNAVNGMNEGLKNFKGEIPKETQDLIDKINNDISGDST